MANNLESSLLRALINATADMRPLLDLLLESKQRVV
jgi:hypothetical protein